MISFGPIPSRRLGKSLGINNITSQKTCSFSCIYCQIGLTKNVCITRKQFYEPIKIYEEICMHLEKLKVADMPDYLTFVANGEPTLDINLGKSIEKLKQLNIPIAVITNGSLLNEQHVRDDLNLADWVSVKVDSNEEVVWKTINRPMYTLVFEKYIDDMLLFSSKFKGILATETMLIEGVNDSNELLYKTSSLIQKINPSVSYISIPTRPPALSLVKAPEESIINNAYQIFSDRKLNVELLLSFEGTNTGYTGNAVEDILNICTVHPIREDTMLELLSKDNADIHVVELLIRDKQIKKVNYKTSNFYIRQFQIR